MRNQDTPCPTSDRLLNARHCHQQAQQINIHISNSGTPYGTDGTQPQTQMSAQSHGTQPCHTTLTNNASTVQLNVNMSGRNAPQFLTAERYVCESRTVQDLISRCAALPSKNANATRLVRFIKDVLILWLRGFVQKGCWPTAHNASGGPGSNLNITQ